MLPVPWQEGHRKASSESPTLSAQFQLHWQHFPKDGKTQVIRLYYFLLRKPYLVVDTSLEVSCASMMPRTTSDESHKYDSTEYGQLYIPH